MHTPSARTARTPLPVRIEPSAAEVDPQRYRRRRTRIERGLAWLVPALLISFWQLAAEAGWIDLRLFPSPWRIVESGRDLIESGQLQDELLLSTRRILIGFALGVTSGAIAGFLLGSSRLARAAFEPTLNALYTVPKLALLPLLLLIFGIGEQPKLILIAMTVFFFMWISVMEAVSSISEGYREAALSFRAGPWLRFSQVVFPAVLPQLFVAMRVSAGVSVLVLVGAEFVQGGNGIGYLIWNSWSLFLADRMYVGIVVVALMGVIFSMIIQAVGRFLTPWEGAGRRRRRRRRTPSYRLTTARAVVDAPTVVKGSGA